MLKQAILALLMLLTLDNIASAHSSEVMIRPQLGVGFINTHQQTSVAHAGVRILLPASDNKRYGLELSQFSGNNHVQFKSVGIVLEQRLWNSFHMAIGTVGYLDYDQSANNPFGLMTNLGWEPDSNNGWAPFITYRNDLVFANTTNDIHSLSVGITLRY